MIASATKLFPMSADSRNSWPLQAGWCPAPPSTPGESVRVESSFAGPKAFTGLRVGPDHRLWELAPGGGGLTRVTTAGIWRVDEITIDDVAIDHAIAALEAEAIVREDQSVLVVHGAFGVGSRVTIRATNVGDTASYFYATWELEDVS